LSATENGACLNACELRVKRKYDRLLRRVLLHTDRVLRRLVLLALLNKSRLAQMLATYSAISVIGIKIGLFTLLTMTVDNLPGQLHAFGDRVTISVIIQA